MNQQPFALELTNVNRCNLVCGTRIASFIAIIPTFSLMLYITFTLDSILSDLNETLYTTQKKLRVKNTYCIYM